MKEEYDHPQQSTKRITFGTSENSIPGAEGMRMFQDHGEEEGRAIGAGVSEQSVAGEVEGPGSREEEAEAGRRE